MSNHTCKLKKDWEIKVHSCTRSCRFCMNCGECTEHNPQVDKNQSKECDRCQFTEDSINCYFCGKSRITTTFVHPSNTIIEHCDEKDCPECNLKAYNKGKADTIQSLKEKINILKEKTQEETGAYKYDFAYEEVLDLLDKENKTYENIKR